MNPRLELQNLGFEGFRKNTSSEGEFEQGHVHHNFWESGRIALKVSLGHAQLWEIHFARGHPAEAPHALPTLRGNVL